MFGVPQLPPGSQVGRFRIEGRLGSGGMGVVYSARDAHVARTVALKVMSPRLAEDAAFRERFRREATVLGRLDSPHIVQVFDHGEHDGLPWIATQLVPDGDLDALIAQRGPLPPHLAALVCAQVASALEDAHAAGVLHRDVKPSNVLVQAADRAQPHTYLCDFGIAHVDGPELTATGSVAGSWGFMSPERGRGEPATPASDIYAVGCLLWNCLTGSPPYPGTEMEMAIAHAREPVPQLPGRDPLTRELNTVLARALAKEPAQRHASAAELAGELDALAAGRGLGRPLVPAAGGPARRPRRTTAVAVGAALIIVAGGVLAVAWPDDPDPEPGPDPSSGTEEPTQPSEPVDRPITSDYDGDGLGDVAMYEWSNPQMPTRLLRSQGDAFAEPQVIASVDGMVRSLRGDVNGDGVTDLVTVDEGSNGYFISVVYGQLDEDEQFTLDAPRGSDSVSPVLGDYTGDGRADLALTSDLTRERGQQIWVSRSTQNGFTDLEPWYESQDEPSTMIPGDFDGDGNEDFVLARSSGLELLTSDGSSFSSQGEQPITQQVLSPSGGDFDGNGTDELVSIGNQNELVSVWSFTDGTWEDTTWLQIEDPPSIIRNRRRPSVGDYDGDRRDDVLLLTGDYESPPMTLWVLRSTGTGFEQPQEWRKYDCQCETYFEILGPRREG